MHDCDSNNDWLSTNYTKWKSFNYNLYQVIYKWSNMDWHLIVYVFVAPYCDKDFNNNIFTLTDSHTLYEGNVVRYEPGDGDIIYIINGWEPNMLIY